MNFWQLIVENPKLGLVLFFGTLSIFSNKTLYITLFIIFLLIVETIAGKTTSFNFNIVATIGMTLSLAMNGIQFYQNKKIKEKKGGK